MTVSPRWRNAVSLGLLASVLVISGCVVTAHEEAAIAGELRALGGVEAVDVTHHAGNIMTLEYLEVTVRMRAGASAEQFRQATERMNRVVLSAQLVTPTSGPPTPASPWVSCVCVLKAEQEGRSVVFGLLRNTRTADESGLATLAHDLLADADVLAASINHADGQLPPNASAYVQVNDPAAAGRVVTSHPSVPGLHDMYIGAQRTPTDPDFVVAAVPLTPPTAATVAELLDLTTTIQPSRTSIVRVVSGLVDVTTRPDPGSGTSTSSPTSPSTSLPPGTGPARVNDPQGLCGVPGPDFAAGPVGTRLRAVLATVPADTVVQFRPGGCQVNVRVVGSGRYEPSDPDPASGVDHTKALLSTG